MYIADWHLPMGLIRAPWETLLPLGQSGPQPGDRVSLESMTLPGSFVGVDTGVRQQLFCQMFHAGHAVLVLLTLSTVCIHACIHQHTDALIMAHLQGVVVIQRDDGSEGFTGNHTFIVREGRDSKRLHGSGAAMAFAGTISLELLARPGYFVTAPSVLPNSTTGQQGSGCGGSEDAWEDDPDLCRDMLVATGTGACRGSNAGAACSSHRMSALPTPTVCCHQADTDLHFMNHRVHADLLPAELSDVRHPQLGLHIAAC